MQPLHSCAVCLLVSPVWKCEVSLYQEVSKKCSMAEINKTRYNNYIKGVVDALSQFLKSDHWVCLLIQSSNMAVRRPSLIAFLLNIWRSILAIDLKFCTFIGWHIRQRSILILELIWNQIWPPVGHLGFWFLLNIWRSILSNWSEVLHIKNRGVW